MTDKVQKIKEWISKERDGLMDAQGNFEYPEHEGAYYILSNLDTYIDSMQENPCDGCTNRKGCVTCENGELRETVQEEPVSEELWEAAQIYYEELQKEKFEGSDVIDAFRAGANWQKKQDQETIELAEDHAMLAGMEKMKEQMMEKAVEATVTDIRTYKHENEVDFTIMLDKGIIPYETEEELKLIIIKED